MTRIASILCLALLTALVGCGREQSSSARVQPMAPGASSDPKAEPYVDVPRLESLRFDPDAPVAGRSARAVVETSADAPGLRLEYAWKLGGRPAKAERSRIDLTRARPGARLELVVTPFVDDQPGIPMAHAVRLRGPAPRVLGVSFDPALGLTADAAVEARPIVEDADPRHSTTHFQWLVNDRRQSAYESTFSTAGLRRGDRIRVEVTVSSAGETSAPFLSEPIRLENAAPRLALRPLETDESGGIAARLDAVDPDGDAPIRFALVAGPEGLAVSQDGRLTWPADRVQPGSHAVEVAVRDALGAERTSRFSLDVGAPAAPAP